jgi:predicted component of type VI protein secretion system
MRLLFPNAEHAQIELSNGSHSIGSAPNAKVKLFAPGILEHHCDVQVNGETAMLTPAPGAPVTLNGAPLTRSTEARAGDVIVLADVRVRIVAVDKAAPGAGSVPITQKRHDDADDGRTRIRSALPKFMLRGVSGVTFGKVFPLAGVTVIGRNPECDISIPTDEISRRHAELRPSQDGVMVEDLGSANGTFVNDRRITRELIKHGDELRFDQLRFQLVAPGREMMGGGVSAGSAPAANAAAPKMVASAVDEPAGGIPATVWIVLLVLAIGLLLGAMKFANVF